MDNSANQKGVYDKCFDWSCKVPTFSIKQLKIAIRVIQDGATTPLVPSHFTNFTALKSSIDHIR